jgi:hypothetical protein
MLKAKQQSENSEMGICREGSSALWCCDRSVRGRRGQWPLTAPGGKKQLERGMEPINGPLEVYSWEKHRTKWWIFNSSIATFCQRNRKNRRNRPFPFVTRLIAHPAVTLQHFPHVFSVKSAWVALGPWRRAHQGWFISGWDMCVIWTSCHGMV